MQWESRINITVSSSEVWKRFEDAYDLDLDLASLATSGLNSFTCDNEDGFLACGKYDLTEKVKVLAKVLGEDGIVIADATSSSVAPGEDYAYFFGTSVKSGSFNYEYSDKFYMFHDTNISDIRNWIEYGGFNLGPKENQQIERCLLEPERESIHQQALSNKISDLFTKTNIQTVEDPKVVLPSEIVLRETGNAGRVSTIENLREGVNLTLKQNKHDEYDSTCVEVFYNDESIGILPSDVSNKLYALLKGVRMTYEAKVVSVIPLSKRNKHCKSPIVTISIIAEKNLNSVTDKSEESSEISGKNAEHSEKKDN